jgi:hypothetical protein
MKTTPSLQNINLIFNKMYNKIIFILISSFVITHKVLFGNICGQNGTKKYDIIFNKLLLVRPKWTKKII